MKGEKLKTDRGKTGPFRNEGLFSLPQLFSHAEIREPSVTAGSDTTAHTVEFSFLFFFVFFGGINAFAE